MISGSQWYKQRGSIESMATQCIHNALESELKCTFTHFFPCTDSGPQWLSVSSTLHTKLKFPVCTTWPLGLCTRESHWLHLPSELPIEST